MFAAAEALNDRLAVLEVESARFKENYRPNKEVFTGLHTAVFFAPAPAGPGSTVRDRFGRVARVGAHS